LVLTTRLQAQKLRLLVYQLPVLPASVPLISNLVVVYQEVLDF